MMESREVIEALADEANLQSVINGGMVNPQIEFIKEKNHYTLRLFIPSVDIRDLRVEVSESSLIISQTLDLNGLDENHIIENVIDVLPLPTEVDFKNIVAKAENESLVVILPFNELASGYHRDIDINM